MSSRHILDSMVVDLCRVDAQPRKLHNRQVAMTISSPEKRHVDCKRGHVLLQRYISISKDMLITRHSCAPTPPYSAALPPSNFRWNTPGFRAHDIRCTTARLDISIQLPLSSKENRHAPKFERANDTPQYTCFWTTRDYCTLLD